MRFHYYGLTLCRNILLISLISVVGLFALDASQPIIADPVSNSTEPVTEPDNEQMVTAVSTPSIQQPVQKTEPPPQKKEAQQQPVQPAAQPVQQASQPVQQTQQQVITRQIDADSLAKILSQLVYLYSDLQTKYAALNDQYQKLNENMANPKAPPPQAVQIQLMQPQQQQQTVQQPAVTDETIQGLPLDTDNNTPKDQMDINDYELPPAISLTPVPQYVKMKYKGKNKEVEFYLDPYFADMNFDITPDTNSVSVDVGQQSTNKSIERAMGKLSEKLDQIKVPQPAPVIGPKIELKPEPEMVKKQSGTIDKNAVDSLYKAQKLFYAKKYNSALAEINRSLKKQETALGYAIQGSLYYTLNEKDLAVESWRNALELDPDMEDVRQALSRYER